jgi:hypothetical protein
MSSNLPLRSFSSEPNNPCLHLQFIVRSPFLKQPATQHPRCTSIGPISYAKVAFPSPALSHQEPKYSVAR